MQPYKLRPPERPISEYRAVKYKGDNEVTVMLPGLGERTWNAGNRKLVDATDWPESVMSMFLDNADWQIIEGYKTMTRTDTNYA